MWPVFSLLLAQSAFSLDILLPVWGLFLSFSIGSWFKNCQSGGIGYGEMWGMINVFSLAVIRMIDCYFIWLMFFFLSFFNGFFLSCVQTKVGCQFLIFNLYRASMVWTCIVNPAHFNPNQFIVMKCLCFTQFLCLIFCLTCTRCWFSSDFVEMFFCF